MKQSRAEFANSNGKPGRTTQMSKGEQLNAGSKVARRSAGREEQHDESGNEQGGQASERASSKGTKEEDSGASRSKDYELREASSRMITDVLHPLRSTRSSIINHYIPTFQSGFLAKISSQIMNYGEVHDG